MNFFTNLEELNFIIFHNLDIKVLIIFSSTNKYLNKLLVNKKYWHNKFIYYNRKIIDNYIPTNILDWDKCFKYSTLFSDIIKLRNEEFEFREEFEWIDNCVNEANDIMTIAPIKIKREGWVNSNFMNDDKYSYIRIVIKDFNRLIYIDNIIKQLKCSNVNYKAITFQFNKNNYLIPLTKHERLRNSSNTRYYNISKEEFNFIIAAIIYDGNYISITDNNGISLEEEELDPAINEECERLGMYKLLKHLKSNKLLK